ncbi:hypothetical protein HF1_04470 [Mycoplasma haemofelis str. Langford 1]|uniref:Uncharacterized protein n=1 Tax=Mycoplasma haemofelis (strain Langford 1) TaxID=941640 RepID=E8ZH34_MYCHL|nr:hypothetical protein HF1_04470 [Mycoplasma haemofelis str. Langford 1]
MAIEGSLATKIATGVAGTGAIAGGGAFMAYKALGQDNITKYLHSLGRELATSDEDWSLIKKNYSLDKEDSPISGIPKAAIETKLDDLKKWCGNHLKEEFSHEKAKRGDYT